MLRCLLLSALGSCTLSLMAQAPDQLYTATPQQLAVTKVILAQEAAWNRGDLDMYLRHYKDAPDTEAILAGPVRGLNNIRAAFHLNFPTKESMGALEDSEVEVRALGENFAMATGKYRLVRPRKVGGQTEGTFVDLFEKTPEGWRVIFSETT